MDLGERYLEIALRFRRLAPTLVESYVGPAALAARIEAEEPLSEPELAEQAGELRAQVAETELDVERAAWLDGQLQGVEAACDWLSGEPLGYRELVERCYGLRPVDALESQFQAAHDLLASALPGSGTLPERYALWKRTQLVAGEQLLSGLRSLSSELGRRTRERWPLPEREEVSFELVNDQRWAANAEYLGGLRTRVQVNAARPVPAWRMVELVAHEAYPGHHTEAVCKTASQVDRHGRQEFCVWLYPTPQALVAEAIAMLAPEILLGEEIDDIGAACLSPLGIDYDIGVSRAVRRASELLLAVRSNLAAMLHDGRLGPEGAHAYARRWLTEDDTHVDRVVNALLAAEWPPYASCYPEGLRLARHFVRGDPQRFERLLHEQLSPAALGARL